MTISWEIPILLWRKAGVWKKALVGLLPFSAESGEEEG
jgi:hypothetical protein